jgi:hypothetical protein
MTTMRAAVAGAVGALVAMAVMGAAGVGQTSKTVRAERFELVDSVGQVRGVLHVGPDGPRLVLYERPGLARVALSVGASAGLTIYDKAGEIRIGMGDDPLKDGPALVLLDTAGGVAWRTP